MKAEWDKVGVMDIYREYKGQDQGVTGISDTEVSGFLMYTEYKCTTVYIFHVIYMYISVQ